MQGRHRSRYRTAYRQPGLRYERADSDILKSASKIDHVRTGGTLLNMKFPRATFNNDSIYKLADLIRSYFKLDGHHIQFNVIDAKTLREAQINPEQHRKVYLLTISTITD
jgi:pyruvate-formate lyase